MSKFCLLILFATVVCAATSCYRMPEEDEYSLVPFTNNPDVTRDPGSNSLIPGNI